MYTTAPICEITITHYTADYNTPEEGSITYDKAMWYIEFKAHDIGLGLYNIKTSESYPISK